MRQRFRMDGRRGGFTAAAVEETLAVEEERDLEPVAVEAPRERMRFLRRDYVEPSLSRDPLPRREPFADRVLETLGSAIEKLASRETPAPILNVHLASPDLSVSVSQPAPQVDVHPQAPDVNVEVSVPEQPAPQVHFAPEVTVEAPPTTVEVNVPQGPAPVVNVENNIDVPRPRPVRVEKQSDGTVRYVPEDE